MVQKLVMVLGVVGAMGIASAHAGAPAADYAKGEAVYKTNCALCHGDKGDGNGVAGAAMNPKPRNFATDKFKAGDKLQNVFDSITKGLPNTSMAGYAHISEGDRWQLAHYVLKFRGGEKPAAADKKADKKGKK